MPDLIDCEAPWHGVEKASPSKRRPISSGVSLGESAPCADPCPHAARCARGEAYRVFASWVQSGRVLPGPREPSAQVYARVFHGRELDDES